MIAEVIAIGDELTSGQRLDTNSQWLSQRLNDLGVLVAYHTTVVDRLEANVDVFRQASRRADIIVCTGGLGPTADDLTREALAQTGEVALVEDAASLRHIEGIFLGRGRSMPERNRLQALFPEGSQPIPNPTGTAPGIAMRLSVGSEGSGEQRGCFVFALPGVPREMHVMWEETVAPSIRDMLPESGVTVHRKILCFGAGESHIEAMLPDIIRRGRQPQVGITASSATITLRVTATAHDRQTCLDMMEPTLQEIRNCLGELVFGEDDEELHDILLHLLRARDANLAIAEWGGGGRVGQLLAEPHATAPRYVGGAGLGALHVPHPLLPSVDAGVTLDEHGARTLAVAAKDAFATTIGVGLLLPESNRFDEEDDSARRARGFWSIVWNEETYVGKFALLASQELNQERAAKIVINELRKLLDRSSVGDISS